GGGDEAGLGDERAEGRGRGAVEGGVERRGGGGRGRAPADAAHLGGVALLDDDGRAGGDGGVDGRAGRRHVERDAVVAGEHGQPIGADLVGGIAVGGDAVGAGDDEVDEALLHHVGGRHVRDEPVGNALLD